MQLRVAEGRKVSVVGAGAQGGRGPATLPGVGAGDAPLPGDLCWCVGLRCPLSLFLPLQSPGRWCHVQAGLLPVLSPSAPSAGLSSLVIAFPPCPQICLIVHPFVNKIQYARQCVHMGFTSIRVTRGQG